MPEPLHDGGASFKSDAHRLEQLLLFRGWLFGTETCVSTSSEFVLELFNAPCGVYELEFACVKRMANVTNVNAKFFSNASSLERVSATAGNFGFTVIGMDIAFHDVLSAFACVERRNVEWKLK